MRIMRNFIKYVVYLITRMELLAVTGETRDQILAEAEADYLFTSDDDLITEM